MSRGCLMTAGDSTLMTIEWALLLSYDIVMMTFMLIPAFRAYKQNGMSQVSRAMYKDGITYCIYLIAVSLANLLVGLVLSPDYFDIMLITGRSVRAILACRVILHIREVGESKSNKGESYYVFRDDVRFIGLK
ncbi:hypothetical protein BDQ17DRAFT_1089723 [Cyathus striatus]|nr:hypothetical protein BDQ17DRAFT_1089723 [Cyathus striatus]